MSFTREAVYTYVRNAVANAHSGIYITSRPEMVTKSFPAVQLIEANRSRPEQYATLANDDDQYVSTFEAEIYSNKVNGAAQEAYDILGTVESAFKRLGYFETFCEPILNIDPSVYRIMARFTKQIGMGDSLPQT